MLLLVTLFKRVNAQVGQLIINRKQKITNTQERCEIRQAWVLTLQHLSTFFVLSLFHILLVSPPLKKGKKKLLVCVMTLHKIKPTIAKPKKFWQWLRWLDLNQRIHDPEAKA